MKFCAGYRQITFGSEQKSHMEVDIPSSFRRLKFENTTGVGRRIVRWDESPRSFYRIKTGIGTPSAARICCFVQPAQQMYFQGSATEIARLSLLRSRPAAAHEGHCATQFRPIRRLVSM